MWADPAMGAYIFQSTLSLRRATQTALIASHAPTNFNPRSPCGERQEVGNLPRKLGKISIHALLAESDGCRIPYPVPAWNFNPRSPCGERPSALEALERLTGNFNPRSPCGERLLPLLGAECPRIFQSTLSLRRATFGMGIFSSCFIFQSTLSLRRATQVYHRCPGRHGNFNPRSPCGERRGIAQIPKKRGRFQSTLSLRRATSSSSQSFSFSSYFNPRSPCGERPGRMDWRW